jgi:hypothetical protein
MTFHPHKQSKFAHVDIHHPSFPWRDGKPDWPRYLAEKAEERLSAIDAKYSRDRCQYVDIKGVCGSKVNGMLEMVHNGRPALVPVCDKHLELLRATQRLRVGSYTHLSQDCSTPVNAPPRGFNHGGDT